MSLPHHHTRHLLLFIHHIHCHLCPPQPPSTTTSAASKGKARAEAPTSASSAAPPAASSAALPAASSVTPPSPHYNLRGKKRPADMLAEKPLNSTEEDTPHKSGGVSTTDVPRVQVDAASPPPPTHPVLIDPGVKIAAQEIGRASCRERV